LNQVVGAVRGLQVHQVVSVQRSNAGHRPKQPSHSIWTRRNAHQSGRVRPNRKQAVSDSHGQTQPTSVTMRQSQNLQMAEVVLYRKQKPQPKVSTTPSKLCLSKLNPNAVLRRKKLVLVVAVISVEVAHSPKFAGKSPVREKNDDVHSI
jgi:hypothetical protein